MKRTIIDASQLELTEKVVAQVVSGVELFIPMGELVDFEKEIDKIISETRKKTVDKFACIWYKYIS